MTLGVRVWVEDEKGKILLVRHTYVKGWFFPGGGVENGESQHAAAVKELFEEASIRAEGDMQLLGVYWNRHASRRDHVSLFRCTSWKKAGEFQPNREIAEARFFNVDNLPEDITAGTLRRIREQQEGSQISDIW